MAEDTGVVDERHRMHQGRGVPRRFVVPTAGYECDESQRRLRARRRTLSRPPTPPSTCSWTWAGSPATSPCSTGKRHEVQVQETERLGQEAYCETFWDEEEVFYGHVLGCKGLERPAVVLCVNDTEVRDRAREKLYVGMSRATDQLIVVGDPAVVREMGGPGVANRLGLA
jgi:UvrD-like helicase C-terminal domain